MSGERGLDIEIARAVFGHIVPDREQFLRMYSQDILDGDPVAVYRLDNGGMRFEKVPHYSQDIAAAWLVVSEMRRQDRYHGFCWSVHQEIGYDERVSEDLGWLLLERDASEVASLICRGALRAIAEPSVLDLGGADRKNAALAVVRGAQDDGGAADAS